MLKRIAACLGIVSLLFIYACNQTNVTEPAEKTGNPDLKVIVDKGEYQKLYVLRVSGKGFSDPFKIEKVSVEKDSLAITVSYYGAVSFWGTKLKHTFTLCWDGDATILCYPMPANLILTHNANGYNGNTKYIETLMFSLKDLGIQNPKDYVFNVYSVLNPSNIPDGQ